MRASDVILTLLVAFLCGCKGTRQVDFSPGQHDSLVVTLIGRQSVWTAQYPGPDKKCGKLKFPYRNLPAQIDPDDSASADDFLILDTLHLPEHCKVSFRFTSIDVIHSAYFPQMRLQMNAVPGMYTLLHYITPAVPLTFYDLLCNRICGPKHFQMHMKILVEPRDSFEKWCKRKKGRPSSDSHRTMLGVAVGNL